MKPGITFERHIEIGRRLAAIRDELLTLSVEVANAYPRSGERAKFGRRLDTALNAVDSVRCVADSVVYGEHPEKACACVYYRGEEQYGPMPHTCDTRLALQKWYGGVRG